MRRKRELAIQNTPIHISRQNHFNSVVCHTSGISNDATRLLRKPNTSKNKFFTHTHHYLYRPPILPHAVADREISEASIG